MCTTYGGLRVGRYSVLPSYSRVFSRFYQGYLGFARSSRLFVMFGLKTIFDGKKNVTKRVFCFKKSHLLTKMEVFKDILMVCRGFDIAGISPPVGSVLWA